MAGPLPAGAARRYRTPDGAAPQLLARVDGKSPVEYLSPVEQQTVRDIAMPLIADPIDTVEAVLARTAAHLALEDQL